MQNKLVELCRSSWNFGEGCLVSSWPCFSRINGSDFSITIEKKLSKIAVFFPVSNGEKKQPLRLLYNHKMPVPKHWHFPGIIPTPFDVKNKSVC